MKILKKIAKAKEQIKSESIKKDGKNTFSKYAYFTPDQVERMVFNACQSNGLLTMFNLNRDQFGEVGTLTIYDINSDEKIEYNMATAIPSIKATNVAQQLGGCVTYTERYLKMSAFGIVENSLDFDDKDNSKKPETKKQVKTLPDLIPNDLFNWDNAVKGLKNGYTIDQVKIKWSLTKENQEKLISEAL